jgi:hypothetical protein
MPITIDQEGKETRLVGIKKLVEVCLSIEHWLMKNISGGKTNAK